MTPPEHVTGPLHDRRDQRPFFDERRVPGPPNEYVCWLDVMGAESVMRRSHRVATIFVMKLHVAALEATAGTTIDMYPVVDGLYICCGEQRVMLTCLKAIMTKLALTFCLEVDHEHRFAARGALAFGPVVKGRTTRDASNVLNTNRSHTDKVLVGLPLVQAHADERRASPFGIYVHESARSFAPPGSGPLPFTHWKWWQDDGTLASELKRCTTDYLAWCLGHSTGILYEKDRIVEHQKLAEEYFHEI